ncbi:MAG: hypothetical protein AAGM38_14545 [Pseudomonadota bacterium]
MDGLVKLGGAVLGGCLSVFVLAGLLSSGPFAASAAQRDLSTAAPLMLAARDETRSPAASRSEAIRRAQAERARRIAHIRARAEGANELDARERMAVVHFLRSLNAQKVGP